MTHKPPETDDWPEVEDFLNSKYPDYVDSKLPENEGTEWWSEPPPTPNTKN